MFLLSMMRPLRLRLKVSLLLASVVVTPPVSADTFSNFLGMKFVTLPGGSFNMGAASKEPGVPFDELPQHAVQIGRFQIMSTEVTLAQYKQYIIDSSRIDIVTEEFMDANAHGDTAPVTFVSWNDTRNFIFWLNKNKPANDKGKYRLPSESEWEYACHAGGSDVYCGGETASSVAWYLSNTVSHQQPVAQKAASEFGLYDMSGNVREWVEDCYHPNYENAPTDGGAWIKSCASNNRIIRGGSWKEDKQEARATGRLAVAIPTQSVTIGFRVVRDIP